MCAEEKPAPGDAVAAAPRPAAGVAVDPITLTEADEVRITTLVDNSYDALMGAVGPARRAPLARAPRAPAPQFEDGTTIAGLIAEHGFAALVEVRGGDRWHTLMFDTGVSPDGVSTNIERLGVDTGAVEMILLSHGHFDHVGGLAGLARRYGRRGLPLTMHPRGFSRRRLSVPGQPAMELPTLSRRSLEQEGFEVIERRQPSLLLDGRVLLTGEVDRTTDFERGLPGHEAWQDGAWGADPWILDDQALVVNVRGRGLVVLTGCGHAGAVNIARHALRLTGVDRLHALIGGFHLTGPAFEPIIEPTVSALTGLAPDLIVPAHCTGFAAQHRMAAALPDAFVPNAVGTSYVLAAA